MDPNARTAIESPIYQGEAESIPYLFSTAPWDLVNAPSSPVVTAEDKNNGDADVTAAIFPVNAPSVSGFVITLSPLVTPVRDKVYRVEVKWTAGGRTYEMYFYVIGDV
jgi:hypothetical protein